MRFGLFLDMRNPSFAERTWPDLYADTLARLQRAEELGADTVWLSEHHQFSDGYLPQPLVLAAAVAARTQRMRIGTAILLAALRDPRHIAEEAAVVDLISRGRLELGFGAGWSTSEYAQFGVDFARRYSLTNAAFAQVRDLLGPGGVTPPPVQNPIPMWLGYQGPQGAGRAGRLGAGLLSLKRELLEPYVAGLAEAGFDPAIARMGGVLSIVVADEPDQVIPAVLPYFAHQASTYRRGMKGLTPDESDNAATLARLRAEYDRTGQVPGLAVLTPAETVTAVAEQSAGLPVTDVYFWAGIAGMPDDITDRHIELLMTEVRPHFG